MADNADYEEDFFDDIYNDDEAAAASSAKPVDPAPANPAPTQATEVTSVPVYTSESVGDAVRQEDHDGTGYSNGGHDGHDGQGGVGDELEDDSYGPIGIKEDG